MHASRVYPRYLSFERDLPLPDDGVERQVTASATHPDAFPGERASETGVYWSRMRLSNVREKLDVTIDERAFNAVRQETLAGNGESGRQQVENRRDCSHPSERFATTLLAKTASLIGKRNRVKVNSRQRATPLHQLNTCWLLTVTVLPRFIERIATRGKSLRLPFERRIVPVPEVKFTEIRPYRDHDARTLQIVTFTSGHQSVDVAKFVPANQTDYIISDVYLGQINQLTRFFV